jgi:hypothetical protein
MALADWMGKYSDRTLGNMILPGSHDAGTSEDYIELTTLGTYSNSATQILNIVEQLAVGTRFFDLRLKGNKGKVVAHHTTGGQGAYSTVPVDLVLEKAAKWCGRHKSEVVIFRISHTDKSTKVNEIIQKSAAGALHTGTGNLCEKKLKDITSQGGGLICILDTKEFGKVIDQAQGIHGYSKYKGAGINNGIATCGCYDGGHALHNVVTAGLKGQYVHNEKHSKDHRHLWQVYWQKTYKNPASSTGIQTGTTKKAFYSPGDKKVHGGTHASTAYMLRLMQGERAPTEQGFEDKYQLKGGLFKKKVMYSTLAFRNYSLPNVFSYDFVNEATNKTIIAMNEKSRQAVPDA